MLPSHLPDRDSDAAVSPGSSGDTGWRGPARRQSPLNTVACTVDAHIYTATMAGWRPCRSRS